MVEQNELYAFWATIPWVLIADPGPHSTVDPIATDDKNQQTRIIYTDAKKVYDLEANIKQAVIPGLNLAVLRAYKHSKYQNNPLQGHTLICYLVAF